MTGRVVSLPAAAAMHARAALAVQADRWLDAVSMDSAA